MSIVYQVRNRQFEGYSSRSAPIWVRVTRTGHKWQDEVSGEVFELFKPKILAEALDRSVEQLKLWERKGLLLQPMFQPEGEFCKRWYSAAQIINCHRVMMGKYEGRKYIQDKLLFAEFIKDIKAVWYERTVVVSEKGVRHGK